MNITITAPAISTILAACAVITAVVLVFAFIKRLISLIAITVCLLLLYAGYLYYTGQRIPVTRDDILKHGQEQVEKIRSGKDLGIDALLPKKSGK
jgi:hypothetical protein